MPHVLGPARASLVVAALILCSFSVARASDQLELALDVKLGPITGQANDARTITFNAAARTPATLVDVQDGVSHLVRGVPASELITRIKPPPAADAVVFVFTNGMQVPVRLTDKAQLARLFIAFEHGGAMGVYETTYRLRGRELPCPKVVYSGPGDEYSVWRYTSQLAAVRFVTWKAHEAALAQPTRQLPSQAGWKLYARHCQACHGMGGQGASRGPDFISDLDAYRRVPPFAASASDAPPSLHDKVKGLTGGQMPTLTHVSNAEIAELWRWLHEVHRGATK